ncbi:hypothetical protein B0T22DRAFT_382272 [Podospora appendiculata]|uniref:Uncharacterized protein n=1 Tax=Podospora appendiculata TaxID=314037 RepID=A0AAE0X6B8_9PEZI|nr:hypothetical protein B0T22DRAFT_382272 [Podospora appendiculata]
MGTRHLICIFWRGEWVLAQYGQWDGGPDFQGARIFKFLCVARNIERLKAGLENHVYVPSDEEYDAMITEVVAWDRMNPDQEGDGIDFLYPGLSRETSARILGMIARAAPFEGEEDTGGKKGEKKEMIPLRLRLWLANDGHCEWAYVIDLDTEALEVYAGHEWKHAQHRFKDVGVDEDSVPAFICAFPFSDIFLMTDGEDFADRVYTALENTRRSRGDWYEDDDDDEWEEEEEVASEGGMDVDKHDEGQAVDAAGHQDQDQDADMS